MSSKKSDGFRYCEESNCIRGESEKYFTAIFVAPEKATRPLLSRSRVSNNWKTSEVGCEHNVRRLCDQPILHNISSKH